MLLAEIFPNNVEDAAYIIGGAMVIAAGIIAFGLFRVARAISQRN